VDEFVNRRKEDVRLVHVENRVNDIGDRQSVMHERLQKVEATANEIKTDTSAIIKEFEDRRSRRRVIEYYRKTIGCVWRSILLPALVLLAFISSVVTGHITEFFQRVGDWFK
jgi:aromatic ring hydroxylase